MDKNLLKVFLIQCANCEIRKTYSKKWCVVKKWLNIWKINNNVISLRWVIKKNCQLWKYVS